MFELEIIVEIGTKEQKRLIESELRVIEIIAGYFEPSTPIKQLIVPNDFDDKVNEIQGTDYYQSSRGHIAVAKNVITNDGIYLVFSRLLYTAEQYNITRLQFYIHEVVHAYNKIRFPSLETKSPSEYRYFLNLYTLFDDYDANRKSFQIVESLFPKVLHQYKVNNKKYLDSYVKSLVEDSKYFREISYEILKFRLYHKDINQFLNDIDPYFDEISKSIIYTYSYIDHCPELKKLETLIMKSKFINTKTIALIEFYRKKFESNDPNLFDGYELIKGFMENFGMRFEDTPHGLYCHVLNI